MKNIKPKTIVYIKIQSNIAFVFVGFPFPPSSGCLAVIRAGHHRLDGAPGRDGGGQRYCCLYYMISRKSNYFNCCFLHMQTFVFHVDYRSRGAHMFLFTLAQMGEKGYAEVCGCCIKHKQCMSMCNLMHMNTDRSCLMHTLPRQMR